MIRDSCVTQSGKYDINMTLGIIDTGNKAFIYPILQIIKQSTVLRSRMLFDTSRVKVIVVNMCKNQ